MRVDGLDDLGIAAEGEPRPLVDDALRARDRDSRRGGRSRRGWPATGGCRTSCRRGRRWRRRRIRRWAGGRSCRPPAPSPASAPSRTCMSKSSASFHMGTRKTVWRRLAEVLLRDLQFDRLIGLLQRAEERRGRLAHLEIDGAVLDLHDHVVVELAVERLEVVVGGAAAVVLRIGPVHVVVVDEAAVEEQAAVRLAGRAPPRWRRRRGCGRRWRGRRGLRNRPSARSRRGRGRRRRARRRVSFHHAATLGSSGSKVSSPPSVLGLPKSTASATRTPQGRKASAMRAICGMKSAASTRGLALTLLMEQALMPSEASRRP